MPGIGCGNMERAMLPLASSPVTTTLSSIDAPGVQSQHLLVVLMDVRPGLWLEAGYSDVNNILSSLTFFANSFLAKSFGSHLIWRFFNGTAQYVCSVHSDLILLFNMVDMSTSSTQFVKMMLFLTPVT